MSAAPGPSVAYLLPDPGIPVGGTKGASIHVDALCGALARQGVSVSLYAAKVVGHLSAPGSSRVSVVPVEVGAVRSGPEGEASRIEASRRFFDLVAEHLSRRRPDWLHERLSLFAGQGSALAASLDTPRLVEVNAPVAEERHRYFSLSRLSEARTSEAEALAGANVAAVSQSVADWALARGAARASVVGNGAHVAQLDPVFWRASREHTRRALGLAPETVVVGFFGSLKPWHGVEDLVEAATTAKPGRGLGLLIVGDGPRRERVSQMLAALPAHVTGVLTGAVASREIPRLLAATDVVAAPYTPNPDFYFSPLKIAEAMAAGRPVVASDFAPVREMTAGAARLVVPGDVAGLAAALTELADDPEERARLGRAARQRARASLDWSVVARRSIHLGLGRAWDERAARLGAPR